MHESTAESGWQALDSKLNSSMARQGDWRSLTSHPCNLWDPCGKMTQEERHRVQNQGFRAWHDAHGTPEHHTVLLDDCTQLLLNVHRRFSLSCSIPNRTGEAQARISLCGEGICCGLSCTAGHSNTRAEGMRGQRLVLSCTHGDFPSRRD